MKDENQQIRAMQPLAQAELILLPNGPPSQAANSKSCRLLWCKHDNLQRPFWLESRPVWHMQAKQVRFVSRWKTKLSPILI